MAIATRDDAGSMGLRLVLSDISQRKERERLQLEAQSEAERANRAKSRFLAAASHDLRQPLSALSMYVSLLSDSRPPPGKLVANVKECISSLSALLSDLLDVSKLEAGVVTPNIRTFPMAEVLASLESALTPKAQFKGLALRVHATNWLAHSDPVLFRRMLGNLIENAIRFTEHGGVLVACRQHQGKSWIEVWDTGIGIEAQQTTEIFEEFKQLGDQARNHGSGLGLAIVAKTAALLGLEVKVRSRPGRGSVFAIELPLGLVAPVVPAPITPALPVRALRIALVDDNAMVLIALEAALQNLGHQVVAADSKAQLLAELGTLAPDIVVSDYRLAHDETGFDVITAVQASFASDIPAILITGDTDPTLMRSMSERGVFVMHKPLELDTLQATLENLTSHIP
jgi:CheY-like chemotaxis protein